MKLLFGVGVNDSDYRTKIVAELPKVNGKRKRKTIWECPYITKWKSMLFRCYSEANFKLNPTYRGCSVCEEWLSFSNFKSWMETQDWEGKVLEKDLLVPNNKVYSPDTCCFVEIKINSFIVERSSSYTGMTGSAWDRNRGKYSSKIVDPFNNYKGVNLGRYESPLEAHLAWLAKKLEYAKLLAEEIEDPKIAKALVDRYENYHSHFKIEGVN